MKLLILSIILMSLTGCASTGVSRVTIEESRKEPSWVSDERPSYEDGDKIFYRSKQTVRGDQRLNACYLIAGNDNRENMIRSMAESFKGATDEAQTDASESAELVLGKLRSGEWSGKVYGFKDEGYYFERYQIRDTMTKSVTERIDCYTLSSISSGNYIRSKNEILNHMVAVDQRVKDAISNKESSFFQPAVEPKASTLQPLPQEIKAAPKAAMVPTPASTPVAAAQESAIESEDIAQGAQQ